jgi:UDP-N-acetylglucosamine acyltransferase
MANRIHPSAIVEPTVELGDNIEIGPFAYVGGTARLGDGTRLHHHASVEGNTVLGSECEVFSFCSIGAKTQDLKFLGGIPGVHGATNDGDYTTLGSDNTILAYGHVAHDCQLGNHIIASNSVGLAGHVIVEDYVVLGAMSGIHQFCRIGAHSMISAFAKVVQDIAPFFIADGGPAIIRAINKIGLERRGYQPEQIDRVKQIHRTLFREGLNRTQALEKLRVHENAGSAEFQQMLEFAAKCERGLAPGSS